LLASLLVASPVMADWQLDNEHSRLNFISIKKGDVAETHTFGRLSGTMTDAGRVAVTIGLDSVDTAIDIRDRRMREILFETDAFPKATIKATVDADRVADLATGERFVQRVEANLSLHGETREVAIDVLVARLGDDRLLVTSYTPVIVDAGAFALAEGVAALRDIAGLPSISNAVPVTFALDFERE
jgi:polyisoprenoid-binding protein YceI